MLRSPARDETHPKADFNRFLVEHAIDRGRCGANVMPAHVLGVESLMDHSAFEAFASLADENELDSLHAHG